MDSKLMKAFVQCLGSVKTERALASALRKLAAAEHIASNDASPWWSEGSRWRVQRAQKSVEFWKSACRYTQQHRRSDG
jgi:hypothetical protein